MVIFNEANVCNLLETISFGQSACEGMEESAIDLLDYAIRHLTQVASGEIAPNPLSFTTQLSHWSPGQELPEIPVESIDAELKRLQDEVTFQVRFWLEPFINKLSHLGTKRTPYRGQHFQKVYGER